MGTSWYTVSAAWVSDTFIGDGASHDLGNGFTYTYLTAYDSGWFLRGYAGRFSYLYTPGQWRNYSSFGGWYNLGNAGLSASFMGDGAYHNLGNGFTYCYTAGWDSAWFVKGYAGRFNYQYTPGQWRTYSSYGGWYNLGNAGLSASFMGDGAYHNLGNGFTYCYTAGWDSGWFVKGYAGRFSYLYTPGQWKTYSSYGGWQTLGNAGLSASFMGDGDPTGHDLGNGWLFAYDIGGDRAMWWNSSSEPAAFGYEYADGTWGHWSTYDGGPPQDHMTVLSASGRSAAFVGDGEWHGLGSIGGREWQYRYVSGLGTWQEFVDPTWADRYQYDYGFGRWYHTSPSTTGWAVLSADDLVSWFVGDGEWHGLGSINSLEWQYRYVSGVGTLQELVGATWADRYQYDYGMGRWYHAGYGGTFSPLSTADRDATFLGDGGEHGLGVMNGVGWVYWYESGQGNWKWMDGDDMISGHQFRYAYGTGLWEDYSWATTEWVNLSAAGQSGEFLGDGSWHGLFAPGGSEWGYRWVYTINPGPYPNDAIATWRIGVIERFQYGYSYGQWGHASDSGGWNEIGQSGLSSAFLGDGSPHDITEWGNPWRYEYNYSGDTGFWFRQVGTDWVSRFSYDYQDEQWSHLGWSGGQTTLGGVISINDLAFMGAGGPHEVDAGAWWYQYAYGDDRGEWFRDAAGSMKRFSYTYDLGQWSHHGWGAGETSLGGVVSLTDLEFIGAGGPHEVDAGTWWYSYEYGDDRGQWFRSDDDAFIRFSYAYATGIWSHHDWNGGQDVLSMPLSLSDMTFIGVDGWHVVSSVPWYYHYDYGTDVGAWSQVSDGSIQRFSYDYLNGQWYLFGPYSIGSAPLGSSGTWLTLGSFMGDGYRHQLTYGGDEWWFKYSSLYQESAWYLADDDVTARFFYQNSIGIWSFADGYGNQMGDLTSLNWTPDFIGDGLRHQVVLGFLTTWKVIYNYTADEMRIIHNDELDDNTWNYIGFSFAGEYSWYDSYTDGAVQASYQLDSYRYMWCLDTSVTFRNHVDGYTMDYSLAGGAADRYARYWETATGINYSKYVYATGWWWGWDGSDFNEDWGPGASNLYRVPGGE